MEILALVAHLAAAALVLSPIIVTAVGFIVFLPDLAGLDQTYRITAFHFLGVRMLSGAFLYVEYRHTFASGTASGDHGATP
jgi:hypothetical protein